jgi:alkylation response protein AidB-like acyl-CoA dehydrogenase
VIALTYAAAYLGIGSGTYDLACSEITCRFPSGSRRLDNAINQRRMAEMSAQLEAARALLHAAAAAFDQQLTTSQLPYMQAKVVCSEAAVRVTQDVMTIFGGTAFASRLPFERTSRTPALGWLWAWRMTPPTRTWCRYCSPTEPEALCSIAPLPCASGDFGPCLSNRLCYDESDKAQRV